jgi:hypothetical protein
MALIGRSVNVICLVLMTSLFIAGFFHVIRDVKPLRVGLVVGAAIPPLVMILALYVTIWGGRRK